MSRAARSRFPASQGVACAIGLAFCLLNPANLRAASAREGEPQHHFGGRTVSVTIPLHTITPAPAAPVSIRAQLVQRTSGLAAPIGPPHEIALTPASVRQQPNPIELEIALPAVRSETGFELRLESRAAGDDAWRSGVPVALRAYPQDLLAPLRSWAQKRRLRIVEDRQDPTLSAFLAKNDIPFESPGAIPPPGASPPVTLYAGEAARTPTVGKAARDRGAETGPAVFFTERSASLPHVVLQRDEVSGALTATVEMPLLDQLETDPAAQQTFLRIFELLEVRSDTR